MKGIVCRTCGGVGYENTGWPPIPAACPDCIRGRQPSCEVLERMAKALFTEDVTLVGGDPRLDKWEHVDVDSYDGRKYRRLALAVWLAEHTEDK